jgi:hypothetical protein
MVATAPSEVYSTAHTETGTRDSRKGVIASITAEPPESDSELMGWRPKPQVQSKLDMIMNKKLSKACPNAT